MKRDPYSTQFVSRREEVHPPRELKNEPKRGDTVGNHIANAGKMVPRAMLEEICEYGLNCGFIPETSRKIDLDAIAVKYGYRAE